MYIVGRDVAGILGGVLAEPNRNHQDHLFAVSVNQNQVIIAALLVLIEGLALAMVPVMMFPMLRRHNERLALGAQEIVLAVWFVIEGFNPSVIASEPHVGS